MATSLQLRAQAELELRRRRAGFVSTKNIDWKQYDKKPVEFIEEILGKSLTEEQKAIAVSVRDNRETNVQASHGIGKCVAQNDIILLSSGLEVPAKSLVGRTFQALTLVDGKVAPVIAFADWNLKEAVYEIVTEAGKRIIRNGQHPLFAAIKWSREGGHPTIDVREWTGVAQMQQWMHQPPLPVASKFAPSGWSASSRRKHSILCAVPKEIPVFGDRTMPDHAIKILAYMIGDGGVTTASPVFTQSPGKQLDEFKECVGRMGCVARQKDKYSFVVVTPIEDRYTRNSAKFGYKSTALGESIDFSCDDHISTDRLKQLTGHTDNTFYGRLKALGIKPIQFYGKGYISKSQRELYNAYGDRLTQSQILKIKGSTRGNAKVALQMLEAYKTSVAISDPSVELLEAQKQLAIAAVNKRNGVQTGVRRNGLKTNPVTQLLRDHGVMGKGSADKTIPDCVFELGKPQMALFLSRLFATDGWASVDCNGLAEIGFCSISQTMVEQVQRLLLRFGIASTVRKKAKVNAWVLFIRISEMQLKFAAEIGIYGKESAVQKVVDVATHKQSSKQVPKWRSDKAPEGTIWEKVVSIRLLNEEDQTVAIEVPDHHTFLTSFYEHNTMLSACLVLWWVLSVGGMAITTAPTKRQVQELLWGEIRKTHGRLDLPGERGQTFLRVTEEARALGFSASDTNSNAFQGVHHERLLVIEDEACGISNDIDEGASSCATGAHNRFLRVGNPITCGGAFEKACKHSHIRVPAWSHPNVSWAYRCDSDGVYRLKPDIAAAILDEKGTVKPQELWPDELPRDRIPGAVSIQWIEEVRAKRGEGSAYWQSRVEGYFPEDSQASIIPRSWLLQARQRYDNDPTKWDAIAALQKSRFGLDVGDGGDDHAIARWQGPVLYFADVKTTKGDREDITRATGWAANHLKSHTGSSINVDQIGVGAGALASLKEQGFQADGVNWGGSANGEFLNLKAQNFWELREALRCEEVAIAPLGTIEEMVFDDLSGIYYEETSTGKIRIEDKKLTRKRLHRSPNAGDAVVYGFHKTPIASWGSSAAFYG